MEIWEIPKIWTGSDCFIIGGGPSLFKQIGASQELINKVLRKEASPELYIPYMESLKNKHVIGVNMAYKFDSICDIVFFGDSSFWKVHKAGLHIFRGLKVACTDHDYPKSIKYVKRDPKTRHGISSRPGNVAWNGNSGAASINLAYHLGAKRIILLGFDMKLAEGNHQHWHKEYFSDVTRVQATFQMHMKGFPKIAEDAKRLGIEILNANPDSAIENFRKINLKDIL